MTDIPDLPKSLPNPLLDSLPDYLKDHANFDRIQKEILNAGASPHSHGEVLDWKACKKCQVANWNRKEFMQRIGFRTGAQYMEWKKVHNAIERIQKKYGHKPAN